MNYREVLNREYAGLENGRDVLLCIVPDTFATAFKPYAEWKHKTGTYVKVTKFSEIGANSTNPDIIKNYIAQCYHTWQYPPDVVLLVGDYGQVPTRPQTDSHLSTMITMWRSTGTMCFRKSHRPVHP